MFVCVSCSEASETWRYDHAIIFQHHLLEYAIRKNQLNGTCQLLFCAVPCISLLGVTHVCTLSHFLQTQSVFEMTCLTATMILAFGSSRLVMFCWIGVISDITLVVKIQWNWSRPRWQTCARQVCWLFAWKMQANYKGAFSVWKVGQGLL